MIQNPKAICFQIQWEQTSACHSKWFVINYQNMFMRGG